MPLVTEIQQLRDRVTKLETKLAAANQVIRLAREAMNYMGDKANADDVVTDEDIAATKKAFQAIQEWKE
jgi:hypothetical protein